MDSGNEKDQEARLARNEAATATETELLNDPGGLKHNLPEANLESLLTTHLGGFGRYQRCLFATLAVLAVGVNWHNLVQVFTGAVPGHWCAFSPHPFQPFPSPATPFNWTTVAPGDSQSAVSWTNDLVNIHNLLGYHQGRPNLYLGDILQSNQSHNSTIIQGLEPDRSCSSYTLVNVSDYDDMRTVGNARDIATDSEALSNLSKTFQRQDCSSWIYDRSQYHSSIVTEWDLVCSRQWVPSLVQSLHMAGCMFGNVIFGDLSDRFGRRTILLLVTVIEVLVGVLTAFVPVLELYVICRFVVGMAVAAQWNCGYVIAVELLSTRWRSMASVLMLYSGSFGIMAMAGLAYCIRDWRTLQLVVSAPLGILLIYFFIAPESPRWLLLHGKTREAKRLVCRIARVNRVKLPEDYETYLIINKATSTLQPKQHFTALDLFRTPKLRFRTLVLGFLWFTSCVTYYCLSLNTSNLGGNDYINFLLSGAAELPAYTFAIWVLHRFGRRPIMASMMILSGLVLLGTLMLPTDTYVARIVLAMGGKMCISVAYVIIYPFSVEQFPTVVRNNGMGIVSGLGGRIGGFVAPYIVLLNMYDMVLPFLICGIMATIGGFISLLLPETRNSTLPETIQDVEDIPNPSLCSFAKYIKRKLQRHSTGEQSQVKKTYFAHGRLPTVIIDSKKDPATDKTCHSSDHADPATDKTCHSSDHADPATDKTCHSSDHADPASEPLQQTC